MAIHNAEELAQYALRQLGHPVIQINVSDDQVQDAIENALTKYYEFHGDGSQRIYLKYIITPEDVDRGYIDVPADILSIVEVLNMGYFGAFNLNNLAHVAYLTDLVGGLGTNGIGTYSRTMSYINTLENVLSPAKTIRFVKYGRRLRFDGGTPYQVNDLIVCQCYTKNLAENFPETFNDLWLRRYTTALIKKQWANNLIKYNGFQLPSGLTIDGSTILSEANNDLEKLEQELRDVWEDPIMPLVG